MNSDTAINFQQVKAVVKNNKHQSDRPVFEYDMNIACLSQGQLHATRLWRGTAQTIVAKEEVTWCPNQGLLYGMMAQPHLNEEGSLTVANNMATSVLQSKKSAHKTKQKSLKFTTRPCTLLSIPFEIVHHWSALKRGEKVCLDYIVLKVQAHTKVTLQKRETIDHTVVSVTPNNWFWRMLFGSTEYYYDRNTLKLRKITGLLEPRDLNVKGKYIEYLGLAQFESPVDYGRLRECIV
ncbi:hypothetical protein BGP78_03480 [Pseudoalteromonas sp. MSK9-3]|uniref:hypothetical protein n=1 Tax=Pseudoalteromonas sp. MSK9-3 TaxID=1897633 RepID=UPI000E6CA6BA|nr:hypothetical protein [Pseudoalteromonas sp. MSK9-3]RJE73335.1 hypothetical protein BGP78_03480 [Pseudoalteromonas sp. MSK9-3]